jgi:transposase
MRKRAPTQYPGRNQQQWRVAKEQACARFDEGHSVQAVADALHVSYEAVRVWRHKWQQGGVEAACAQKPLGAPPRLSREQLAQLEQALLDGPAACGYHTELWTLARIAALIKKLFAVSYHPSHVFRVLQAMNWSCQKPTRQANERNEAAIRKWLDEDWPRIKKGPKPTARP